MADTKISALTASTTPLAGTEVLPIVQGGVTKQVSVADLTAGRAISATQLTLSTGNLIVASGQGVDFSATPGTGTSELLADYEEGTWTPVIAGTTSGVAAGYFFRPGRYIKVGRIVTAWCYVAITGIGTMVGNMKVTDLPFTAFGNFPEKYAGAVGFAGMAVTAGAKVVANMDYGTSEVLLWQELNGANTQVPVGAQCDLCLTITYMT